MHGATLARCSAGPLCHNRAAMTWWESWFGEEYLDLYPHRDVASARREAAFALAHLPARAHSPARPLLRLRPALAAAGGGGLSADRARLLGAAPGAGAPAQPAISRWCAATCASCRSGTAASARWSTSSRASATSSGEPENVAVVAEIERVLARGGGLPLRHVQPRRRPGASGARGAPLLRRPRVPHPPLVERRRPRGWRRRSRCAAPARTEIFRESVRAYTAGELVALLEGAGLRVEATWGDFDATPVGAGLAAPDRARPQAGEAIVIPYAKYPGLSPLFLDFLKGLPRFYPGSADARRRRRARPRAARRGPPGARARLGVSMSRRRGGADGRGARGGPRRRGLGRATRSGLFTGPLFTLMKALDAIHLARELSRRGVPAVPVFWALTDDHDLQEIAQTARPGPDGPAAPRARGRRPPEPPARRQASDSGRRSARSSKRSAPTRGPRTAVALLDAFAAPQRAGRFLRRGVHRDAARSRRARIRCWSSIRWPSRCGRPRSSSSARPRGRRRRLRAGAGGHRRSRLRRGRGPFRPRCPRASPSSRSTREGRRRIDGPRRRPPPGSRPARPGRRRTS